MEVESNNIPVIAKRVWNIVRVAFFMLRKGLSSKGKLMIMDLNLILKRRRKLAGKAISNLMFHGGAAATTTGSSRRLHFSAQREYEFSCSNTPNNNNNNNHHNYFFPITAKRHAHPFFACAHAPPTLDDEIVMKAVLEMLNNEAMVVEASPALPGFGRSPAAVRQLRVTDSPFPVRDAADEDHQVDMAAEEFIKKFYKELKKQT